MILNEGKRKVPVKFYEDKYGTIIYDSNFIQGTSPSLEEAFDKFKDDNFIRDLKYYYDDIIDVKMGRFIPTLEDKTWKGMKYLGKLEIEVETLTEPFFSQSKKSLNYLSKNKNEIPNHLAWIKDMKQKELALKEMFEPEKTNNKLICKHCGVTIPEGCYYERYRGEVYHLECIWDKLINNHDTSLYDEAKKFFWSLQKYIGNWPGYGFDVEEDYVSDTVLVKHNYLITERTSTINESPMYKSPKTNFTDFYNYVINNPKNKESYFLYHKIRIPSTTLLHDYNKHNMQLNNWLDVLNNLLNIEFANISKKKISNMNMYLLRIQGSSYYGISLMDCNSYGIITTIFEKDKNSIDNWIKTSSAVSIANNPLSSLGLNPQSVVLPGQNSNNIITYIIKKVKSFLT